MAGKPFYEAKYMCFEPTYLKSAAMLSIQ